MTKPGEIRNPTGAGLAFSAEDKKRASLGKERRLGLIEHVTNERGWKSARELSIILNEDYGIEMTRQGVAKDLNVLSKRSKYHKRTLLTIIGKYQKKLHEIDGMITKTKSKPEKIKLYNLWTRFAKDLSYVSLQVSANVDASENASKMDGIGDVSISFDDGEKKDEIKQ